jgi:hypothetical protein
MPGVGKVYHRLRTQNQLGVWNYLRHNCYLQYSMSRTRRIATSRPVLGPIQPPTQWVTEAHSSGIKRPWCEAHHLPSFSTEVKNTRIFTQTLLYVFMACCLFNWAEGQFLLLIFLEGPPLWSSGHSSWLQIQRSRVRFLGLPVFSEK